MIDGMMGVILWLTKKTHQGTLAADEEAGLQQAQEAAVALRGETQKSGKVPLPGKRQDEDMESMLLKQTQLEGSIKRRSTHPTCGEEKMKAMRTASALDPSVHHGYTQAWLNVQTEEEEEVVMKTDMRRPRRMIHNESLTCVGIRVDASSRGDDSAHDRNSQS